MQKRVRRPAVDRDFRRRSYRGFPTSAWGDGSEETDTYGVPEG